MHKNILALSVLALLSSACGPLNDAHSRESLLAQTLSRSGDLQTVENFFLSNGIQFEHGISPHSQASALVLSTQGTHALNQLAKGVASTHFGLKIIYSPSDLRRGSSKAFFDPQNNIIGLSHEMAKTGRIDESFEHEMFHADQYKERRNGRVNGMHFTARLLEGDRLSPSSYYGYGRFFSFEELKAYQVSVQAFLRNYTSSRQLSEQELFDLYYTFRTAAEVSVVIGELAPKALLVKAVTTEEIQKGSVNWLEIKGYVSSTNKEFSNGRAVVSDLENGVLLTLTVSKNHFGNLLGNSQAASKLFEEQIVSIQQESLKYKPNYTAALESFGFVLERPNKDKIDYVKLDAALKKLNAIL